MEHEENLDETTQDIRGELDELEEKGAELEERKDEAAKDASEVPPLPESDE